MCPRAPTALGLCTLPLLGFLALGPIRGGEGDGHQPGTPEFVTPVVSGFALLTLKSSHRKMSAKEACSARSRASPSGCESGGGGGGNGGAVRRSTLPFSSTVGTTCVRPEPGT